MSQSEQSREAPAARSPAEVIAGECVGVRLRMLTRAVNRIYNGALRPYGLNISQMNILVALLRLGEAHQQRVCEVLCLDKSTLSRDLGRMRQEGWIRERGGEDARTRLLQVTAAGHALIERAFEAWQAAQRDALALLGEQDHGAVEQLTRSMRARRTPSPS